MFLIYFIYYFQEQNNRTDPFLKQIEKFLEPFRWSMSLMALCAASPLLTSSVPARQMLPSHCYNKSPLTACSWHLQDFWPFGDLCFLTVTWWARVIRHPTVIMSAPSWVSPNAFAEFEECWDHGLCHLLRWKELTCWSLRHPLRHTEWLEAKSYYPASGCLCLCFLLYPELPWTLPLLPKKRKKDELFCRVKKGHCYTCLGLRQLPFLFLLWEKWFNS